MIIYDLVCTNFHQFEGWFRGLDDFNDQKARELVRCPICDSEEVERKISAPKVTQKSNAKVSGAANKTPENSTVSADQSVTTVSSINAEQYAHVQKMVAKVHEYIDQNFTDVGNKFAAKAKEIHSGDAQPENIKGSASRDEIEELNELGIGTVAIPPKPLDKNKLN